MNAIQLFRRKFQRENVIVEMVIWRLPKATPDRPHGIKYRFYCGRDNECLVRYDNEAGKGDHRHYGELEEPYAFTGVDQLIEDFRNDCARLAGWEWDT
jgi:hypothetical protein